MSTTAQRTTLDVTERLLAHEEIRQLAYSYAYALDSRDRELLESLWAKPVRTVSYPDINLLTVRSDYERWFTKGPTVHFIGNHLIDLQSPEQASGKVYCWAQLDLVEKFVDQSILYLDVYVREGGRWLILERRHLLWFGQARAANPIDQDGSGWPYGHCGRGCLPRALISAERARLFLRR